MPYFVFKTGYFNARDERMKAEKQNLEFDIKAFAMQKEHLESQIAQLQENLALSPLEADINRVVELAATRPDVTNVQKMVNAALGATAHPEMHAPFRRILDALAIKDPYRKKRVELLLRAIEKQEPEGDPQKVLRAAAEGNSLNTIYPDRSAEVITST